MLNTRRFTHLMKLQHFDSKGQLRITLRVHMSLCMFNFSFQYAVVLITIFVAEVVFVILLFTISSKVSTDRFSS